MKVTSLFPLAAVLAVSACEQSPTGTMENLSSIAVYAAYSGGNGDLLYMVRTLIECEDASIAVVSPDGSNTRNLTLGTNLRVSANQATWSPDGSMIAFGAFPCGTSPQENRLHSMNADGSGIRQISTSPARDAEYPTWSPDGQVIAFVGIDGAGRRAVFTIGVDGTNLQTVLPSEPGFVESYQSLEWSPDGGSLLFSGAFRFPCPSGCGFGTEEYELYILLLATGDVQRITENRVADEDAVWSPDGQRIAFSHSPVPRSTAPGLSRTNRQLLVMDLATRKTRDISNDPANHYFDGMPAWSPDGTLIAYISTRGSVKKPQGAQATFKIFTVAPSGKGLRKRVTLGPIHQAPNWQPQAGAQ